MERHVVNILCTLIYFSLEMHRITRTRGVLLIFTKDAGDTSIARELRPLPAYLCTAKSPIDEMLSHIRPRWMLG